MRFPLHLLSRSGLGLAVLIVATAGVARADGLPGTIHAPGSTVYVTFLGSEADYTNTLRLVLPNGETQDLFTTDGATEGQEIQLAHEFEAGDEIIFELFARDPATGDTFTWRSGAGGDNPDGFQHFRVTDQGDGTWRAEWEDLPEGGDQDFNDLVFEVRAPTTTIPEPVSMTLLGSGLVGLGGAGAWRRRRQRLDG